MKKRWKNAVFCAALCTLLLYGAAVGGEAAALSDKMIRLHVVAASDEAEDQAVKLRVRDAVLETVSVLTEGAADKEEAAARLRDGLTQIEAAAVETARADGCGLPVTVTLRREAFPTRYYDTFRLPAGVYDSLRVTIGSGQGHNWWCVVFPPVCAAGELTEDAAAEVGLTEGELRLITEDSGGYVVRFRVMELLGKLKGLLQEYA